MDEQVLVIPASLFEACAWQGFVPFDADVHTPLMLPENQQFRPRAEVELDPKWKQLIPYVVITRFGRVALYRRGKGQGEARLHSKCSIGFGGHINPCDTVGSLIGTLRLPGLPRNVPYRVGLSRELSEELQSASWNTACRTLGLIYDGTTDVGRVHLGVAHHLDISGLGDIAAAESDICELAWYTVADLKKLPDELEAWSAFLLERMPELITQPKPAKLLR